MYELVIIVGSKEQVIFVSDNLLDVELRRERHIRSLAPGFAEIRKIEA